MATGIIPWYAIPGKACGSTLGDICDTSEVRGRLLSTHIHTNAAHQQRRAEDHGMENTFFFFKLKNNHIIVFFQFYLSYHLYIVACAGAGATVIALVSFLSSLSIPLPLSPSLHGLYQQIMCQELLFSFPYGLCNHAKEDYTLFLSSNSICCLPSA